MAGSAHGPRRAAAWNSEKSVTAGRSGQSVRFSRETVRNKEILLDNRPMGRERRPDCEDDGKVDRALDGSAQSLRRRVEKIQRCGGSPEKRASGAGELGKDAHHRLFAAAGLKGPGQSPGSTREGQIDRATCRAPVVWAVRIRAAQNRLLLFRRSRSPEHGQSCHRHARR